MNFIVIWSVLKKWFSRPVGNSVGKIFFYALGIIVALGLYTRFNSIQIQRIQFFDNCAGNASLKSLHIGLTLDYTETKSRLQYHDSIISGTTIMYRYNFIKNDTASLSSIYKHADYYGYRTDVKAFDLLTKHLRNQIETIDFNFNIYAVLDITRPYSTQIPSREKDLLEIAPNSQFYHNHFIFNWTDRLTGKDYTDFFDYDPINTELSIFGHNAGFSWGEKGRSLTNECIISTNKEIYSPHFYSLYDVSQFYLKIRFKLDTISSFWIDFPGIVNLEDIYPQPDERVQSKIIYYDADKIKHLKEYGLNVHVNFPESKSLQENRNTVIVFFITLFLTLLSTSLYQLGKEFVKRRKRIKTAYYSPLTLAHRPTLSLRYHHILLAYDCIIALILIVLLAIANPFNLLISEIVLTSVVFLSLFLSIRHTARCRKISSTTNNKPTFVDTIIISAYWLTLIIVMLWWTIQYKLELSDPFHNYVCLSTILLSLFIAIFSRHILKKYS